MQLFEQEKLEQRRYRRGTHFNCVIKISVDKVKWKVVEMTDLSSIGLGFISQDEYNVGDVLWFVLTIEGFMSEIEIKTKGEVRYRREVKQSDEKSYGVQFLDLSEDKKIHIDENINGDRPITGEAYHQD